MTCGEKCRYQQIFLELAWKVQYLESEVGGITQSTGTERAARVDKVDAVSVSEGPLTVGCLSGRPFLSGRPRGWQWQWQWGSGGHAGKWLQRTFPCFGIRPAFDKVVDSHGALLPLDLFPTTSPLSSHTQQLGLETTHFDSLAFKYKPTPAVFAPSCRPQPLLVVRSAKGAPTVKRHHHHLQEKTQRKQPQSSRRCEAKKLLPRAEPSGDTGSPTPIGAPRGIHAPTATPSHESSLGLTSVMLRCSLASLPLTLRAITPIPPTIVNPCKRGKLYRLLLLPVSRRCRQ